MTINEAEQELSGMTSLRYRRLFETDLEGILILDAKNLKIIDSNPFMFNLLGYSRDELLGRELWQINLFRDRGENRTAIGALEPGEKAFNTELRVRTKTDEPRAIEMTCYGFADGGGRFVSCRLRDVTERRAAEEARRENERGAVLLAQIAGRAARLGGWSIQLPDRTLTWSDENCAIHEVPPGYRPTLEEGIGYYPEEYRDEVRRYVDACASEGTPYDFELPKYTAKGRLIWVRSIGEAVRDGEGRIIRLQGAFQDITQRRQAAAEREKLIEELRTALAEVKELREFLSICSYCKKVQDDENFWSQIESYISRHTDTKFSHSICPDCYQTEVVPQLEKMKTSRRGPKIEDEPVSPR
jgi:PAS domain S-box-containing protein